MWTTEHVTETELPRDAVWTAIRDQHSGAELGGGDTFELHGPFAVGSTLSVTPQGQETFTSTITELVPGEVYADETPFEDVTLTFRYRLTPTPAGGTRLCHELVIDGPGADHLGPQLGPSISSDFPEAAAALLEAARERAATSASA